MIDIKQIAEQADMIINGYAFTKTDKGVKVLNLHCPKYASLLSEDGAIIETSMEKIEASIIQNYFQENSKYLEAK